MKVYELIEYIDFRDERTAKLFRKKEDAESELATRKYSYLAKDPELKIIYEDNDLVSIGYDDFDDGGYELYTKMYINERTVY